MLKEQCHCNMIGECRGKGDPLPAMGVREGPGLALGSHGRVGSLFLKCPPSMVADFSQSKQSKRDTGKREREHVCQGSYPSLRSDLASEVT